MEKPNEPCTRYSVSGGFVALLGRLNISLVLTSYQSGLMYCLGRNSNNGLNIHQTAVPKPMGIHFEKSAGHPNAGQMVLCTNHQIFRFENALAPGQIANEQFDGCFVPRTTHLTGRLDAHDIGMDKKGGVIFVNTRFNCLASLSPKHAFEPIWKPDFISNIVDEDRCHLNGLATSNGDAKYATAVSRSDTVDGWRDRRRDGGVVIDISQNKIVCGGLSMPHSPRLHNGQLWVLNSGAGELGLIDLEETDADNRFKAIAFCPGFTRGLRLHDNFAFVGLSKPRYDRFTGLELDDRLKATDSEPWCGVQVINLETGFCAEWFRIDGNIGEVYDLEVIPGIACPMAISPNADEAQSFITYDSGAAVSER